MQRRLLPRDPSNGIGFAVMSKAAAAQLPGEDRMPVFPHRAVFCFRIEGIKQPFSVLRGG